jgi:D-psicose/D-tagatose/L-ribulose 3-epimerase
MFSLRQEYEASEDICVDGEICLASNHSIMKIGFNLLLWTSHLTEKDFSVLNLLKKTGYDGIEIPVFDLSDPAHFTKIGQAAKDHGLGVTAATVLPDEAHNAISENAQHRQQAIDYMQRVIECCHRASVEVLCGPYYQVLGQFTGAFPTERELEHAAEVHRKIAPIAEAAGVQLAVEALNRFEAHLLNTMAAAVDYVKRVDHPNFGTMYDTFHAHIEEKNSLQALETVHASGKLYHVHISENDRGTPGRGQADIAGAIQRLKKLGYNRWMTIEAFGSALPDVAAATRVWRDFFPHPDQVYLEGYQFIRQAWDNA